MTIRQKVARSLRKCADFVDPKVAPSDVFTIKIECDTTQFDEAMQKVTRDVEFLQRLGEWARLASPSA